MKFPGTNCTGDKQRTASQAEPIFVNEPHVYAREELVTRSPYRSSVSHTYRTFIPVPVRPLGKGSFPLLGGTNVARSSKCISRPALLRTEPYSVENRTLDTQNGGASRNRGQKLAPSRHAFNPKKQSARARRLLWAILTSTINPDDTPRRAGSCRKLPGIFSHRIICDGEFSSPWEKRRRLFVAGNGDGECGDSCCCILIGDRIVRE